MQSAHSTPAGIGALAPDFTLPDQNGNKVTLERRSQQESGKRSSSIAATGDHFVRGS